MNNLLNKHLRYFLLYAILILLCSAPLFYWIMEKCYAEDLDELIAYRTTDFEQNYLSSLTASDIDQWNQYNYDLMILPFDNNIVLNKPQLIDFYNPAEGFDVGYRTLYTPVKISHTPYILMSRIAMIEPKDLVNTLIYQYGAIFVILILSLTLIQKRVSKKLWAPFYHTLNQIENYNIEKEDIPQFKESNTKEFIRLNENLTDLISKNLSTYKQQKEFIENASHELQTPLAVFRSQLDILLQDEQLTKAQTGIVQSLYDVSSRLTRLNKNLLLLAKIENRQYQIFTSVNFTELLEQQLYFFQDLAQENQLTLSFKIEKSIFVFANKALVESLISNLISNAIKYNTNNGTISIEANHNYFLITNSGDNIPLDENKIFKRFNKISEEKKGTGLGLSIVKQICNLHQWQINYSFENNLHAFCVYYNNIKADSVKK